MGGVRTLSRDKRGDFFPNKAGYVSRVSVHVSAVKE